jgi:hypothetical protein
MSDLPSSQKDMFARISSSLRNPISAFAGGKDPHTMLSCCGPVLEGMLSKVAATQIRLAHPVDCPLVFKAPLPHEIPERYSLEEHNRMTTRGGGYYLSLFSRAPQQFTDAMHYVFYLRHIPRNVHVKDAVFINDATFRSILREIFVKLYDFPAGGLMWNWHQAREIHHLVNVMGGASQGINPHCEELWEEAHEFTLQMKQKGKKEEKQEFIFLGLEGH